MGPQKYDGPAMAAAADRIKSTHNTLVQERDDLDQYLKRNLSPEWQGNAAYGYQSQQQSWNNACDDVQLMLENLHNALEIAMDNAQGVETALERIWS
jgi:WXG100 family type VII secretion target